MTQPLRGHVDELAGLAVDDQEVLAGPDEREVTANRWENLAHLRASDELKFVVADEADYLWAREVIREHGLGARCPVHLSPVHGALDLPSLAAWILRDRLPVRLTLQQHKLIWGAEAKGV